MELQGQEVFLRKTRKRGGQGAEENLNCYEYLNYICGSIDIVA